MQYRRARPAVALLLLLALLPLGALAAGDGLGGAGGSPVDASAGYGYVFPAPDPSEVVDVPAPFPASPARGVQTRQFPATAEPQPTFAPNNTKHVYVAASDSTITPPNATLYRCDGVNDELEINSAIAAAQGGVVELLDGSFRCSDRITLQANTTLEGPGLVEHDDRDPGEAREVGVPPHRRRRRVRERRRLHHPRQRLRHGHEEPRARAGHPGHLHRPQGPMAYGLGQRDVLRLGRAARDRVDDVEFYECHGVDCHTHGFNMNQDYSDGVERATTNIRFLNCRAVRCGYGVAGDPGVTDRTVTSTNQSRSEWITGFDLHEWQDLINCEVVNCVAENNWESGFHLEPGARYGENGEDIGPRTGLEEHRLPELRQLEQRPAEHLRGPLLHVRLLPLPRHAPRGLRLVQQPELRVLRPRRGGQLPSTGARTTAAPTAGRSARPASDIAITDCTSANNRRWALWLAFSRRITVANFRHTGVAGDRGYQSILGWYKDEPEYQLPVTDSSFEITAVGNGMPIINQEGSRNTYTLMREGTATGGPVLADFSAAPALGGAPLPVRFVDLSTNATLWWWDFGDGNISHEQNPLHAYDAPGTYTVTLMAADELRYDTETKTGCVRVMGPVTASFTANRTAGPVPLGVAFTDTSTGAPTSWLWDFGDGEASTARSPEHVYGGPGTYSVTLTAGNGYFTHATTALDVVIATAPTPAVVTVPGSTAPPTDPDGDGLYDDVNGNGRTDFADVGAVLQPDELDRGERAGGRVRLQRQHAASTSPTSSGSSTTSEGADLPPRSSPPIRSAPLIVGGCQMYAHG